MRVNKSRPFETRPDVRQERRWQGVEVRKGLKGQGARSILFFVRCLIVRKGTLRLADTMARSYLHRRCYSRRKARLSRGRFLSRRAHHRSHILPHPAGPILRARSPLSRKRIRAEEGDPRWNHLFEIFPKTWVNCLMLYEDTVAPRRCVITVP